MVAHARIENLLGPFWWIDILIVSFIDQSTDIGLGDSQCEPDKARGNYR